jgi:Dolichyl-phosphate-mannose-protein mannosyltransferase
VAAFLLLLAASLGLNAVGIGWGLPSRYGWAPDELVPGDVLEARARSFSSGWHSKYPPLQYYLLASVYAPMLKAKGPVPTPIASAAAVSDALYARLFLASRGVSLLMALGLLIAVFLTGRATAGPATAFFAAALVATMPPFAFYAKLANLDVPSLFWWAASLALLVRLLKRHRLVDYLMFATAAVLAICTKDQTYGLYILVIPWILWSRARFEGQTGFLGALRAAGRRELLAALALGLVLFAAVHNLVSNFDGFRAHLSLITGSASRDFREVPGDLSGQLSLFAQTVANLRFTLGSPAFAACLVGVGVAFRRREVEWPPLALLIPALSYYVFFLGVVLYSYDRFVLPIAILLAFFGGSVLAWAWDTRLWWARVGVALLLAHGLGRSLSLDAAMTKDARYAAEGWLKEHASPPALVSPIGPLEYLPRMEGLYARPLGPSVARVQKVQPRFVVVSADYAERADPGTAEHDLYSRLENGELGYRRVFAYRFDSPWLLLKTQDLLDRPGALVRSNLGKVNPEIRIYERDEAQP